MPQEPLGPDQEKTDWPEAWRIIASRYPPIHLFKRVSDNPDTWEALTDLEQATNPRVRDEIGDISLVPPPHRVAGPGASYVMAPFTHINPKGSRFSNGSYGVYYAARELDTAIRETVYHFERFARDASDPPRQEHMRVLLGTISSTLDGVDSLPEEIRQRVLDPDSYAASQPFGQARRAVGSNGISYPSTRQQGGRCIGAFWPDTVGIPIQERHLAYDWNGDRVVRYFDFRREVWVGLV